MGFPSSPSSPVSTVRHLGPSFTKHTSFRPPRDLFVLSSSPIPPISTPWTLKFYSTSPFWSNSPTTYSFLKILLFLKKHLPSRSLFRETAPWLADPLSVFRTPTSVSSSLHPLFRFFIPNRSRKGDWPVGRSLWRPGQKEKMSQRIDPTKNGTKGGGGPL